MKIQRFFLLLAVAFSSLGLANAQKPWDNGKLKVSDNGRFLQHENGTPFFWTGETAWLMFQHMTREEMQKYFVDRKEKGFNVIQCIFHQFYTHQNPYGDYAFADNDLTKPIHTPGSDPAEPAQYDYWDHVDYAVKLAEENGIYLAITPTWAQFVLRDKNLTVDKARIFASTLAERYKDAPNIIWINGGSAKPNVNSEIWEAIGQTIKEFDPNHLVTFHPFGRMQSSERYHNASWLDLNMFTSGHRTYAQDDTPKSYGEDNWRYVVEDMAKTPAKPTIDGEPSYETLHHGLHDHSLPVWKDNDVRRYAYWSVFAGACGHVYGQNSVRQVYIADRFKPESGAKIDFFEALDMPGASHMKHLKNLMLSRPYFDRENGQDFLVDDGEKYDKIMVTRGKDYLMAYNYSGRPFSMKMGAVDGDEVNVWWYDPTSGKSVSGGKVKNQGVRKFKAPKSKDHSDWVLVLDNTSKNFKSPGILD